MIKNKELEELYKLIKEEKVNKFSGELRTGVDLGTANIVLVVVDEKGKIIAGISKNSKVVKDGIVVDYVGAIKSVKELKEKLEKRIGQKLLKASCAIPPGVNKSSVKIIGNVVESSEFILTNTIEEPSAAATVLNIIDGAVVDLGGGTTGISIIKNHEVISSYDEPTGGTHMSLTIAGNLSISLEEAEKYKLDKKNKSDVFIIVKPVIEKMAQIVKDFIAGKGVENIYLVGGASDFDGIEEVFYKVTGVKAHRTEHSLLVTPLGIAKNC